jgi:hypothetical protein
MNRIEKIYAAIVMLAAASPALAGTPVGVPAPGIGIGIGAVVLIGIGYRALKRRIDR